MCDKCATLQATLAERERDIDKLKSDLNEMWVDDKGTVWTKPTAWAYAMVCKARDKHAQDAARLRVLLGKEINTSRFESAPCYLCGYNGKLYFQPSTHPCAEWYHIAKHRALKGA